MSERKTCTLCGNRGGYGKELCEPCDNRMKKLNDLWVQHEQRQQVQTSKQK